MKLERVLLNEEEFSRVVVDRARKERPEIQIRLMGKFLLLVEPEPGRRRIVSLVSPYESYCQSPKERDEVIATFLNLTVYQEATTISGTFAENRQKVMPQVVPPSLLDFCAKDGRELAAIDYVGGLAITFVLDEPDRYSYIHKRVMEHWGENETALLTAALQNLNAMHEREGSSHYQIGKGERLMLAWETFDGYDASRILLSRELNSRAALVVGNPVIAIPHRDYMVMFGDTDPVFVAEMSDRVREDFEGHSYPITSRLFTLRDGNLVPYEGTDALPRMVN
jgi:uncharacterized protein YtpQ (UPF0354 family)